MIAEIIPEAYDAVGKKVFRPFDRRRGPHPSFPMGRYVSQPLSIRCQNLTDVRSFLLQCKGVSDEEQFGKPEYWQPPDQFEHSKKGDCDDFALWTWRQLLSMGYDARFIGGKKGRYGIGHAWVEYFRDNKWFLLDPTLRLIGERLPRLSTLAYRPELSVVWDGEKLSYYAHKTPQYHLGFKRFLSLAPEWLVLWGWFWIRNFWKLPRLFWRLLRRFLSGFRWMARSPKSGN